jgi:hypothetical protein
MPREGCEVTEELVKEILQACPEAHIKTEVGNKGGTMNDPACLMSSNKNIRIM